MTSLEYKQLSLPDSFIQEMQFCSSHWCSDCRSSWVCKVGIAKCTVPHFLHCYDHISAGRYNKKAAPHGL